MTIPKLSALLAAGLGTAAGTFAQVDRFVKPPLDPVAVIGFEKLVESSGLIRSGKVPGRFWSLNDGGNGAWLFAMDRHGTALSGPLKVEGVENHDWESLSRDESGHLWIGDFGNNSNQRKNLMIYQIEEPPEKLPERVRVKRILRFRFEDQKTFPPEKRNFDCEAMFILDGKIYLLTKHRSDTDTKLYVLEETEKPGEQKARLLERFPIGGQVTGAALSPERSRLAVLTFSGIWIFDLPENRKPSLTGRGQKFNFPPWALKQIEGIAWIDQDTLMISNEQKDIFHVPLDHERWVSFEGKDPSTGRRNHE